MGAAGVGETTTAARLLDAAEHHFARHGFAGSRLVDIAGHAGMTTGAFYRHFDHKTDLLDALFGRFDLTVAEALAGATDLVDAAASWLHLTRLHPGTVRAAVETTGTDPRFALVHSQARDRWITALDPLVATTGIPASMAQNAAGALVDGLTYRAYAEAMDWRPRRAAGDVAETFVRLLVGGLYR